MKLRALILDAGGVLVHPIHGDWNIPAKYREYLGAYADEVPGERWLAACREAAHFLREDIPISGIEEEHHLRREFLKDVAIRMDWRLSADAIEALAEDFTFNTCRYAWYDDVLPHLDKWHRCMKVGILSDAMPSFPRVVRNHPAYGFVHAMVISTELGCAKPDARMYLEICRQLDVKPEQCLFVDDKICNLEGAMQLGMAAVQMCRDGMAGWNGDKVHDLSELNVYMEGLN